MAFFKFRKTGTEPSTAAPSESVEVLRRRAKHRLIGSAVLVLLAVVGFPLLFDTQPRPIAVDIAIDIPDKTKTKPLMVPGSTLPVLSEVTAVAAPASVASAPRPTPTPAREAAPALPAAVGLDANEQVLAPAPPAKAVAAQTPPAKPASKPESRSAPKPEVRPEPRETPRAETKALAPRVDPAADKHRDGLRAQAILEGADPPQTPPKASAAPAASERYVVQIGAFADAAKAQEVRLKVERGGLKTYTHVAETKDGPRTRVRVGPFSTRAEADKAAARIKAGGLPAAILTL